MGEEVEGVGEREWRMKRMEEGSGREGGQSMQEGGRQRGRKRVSGGSGGGGKEDGKGWKAEGGGEGVAC